MQLDEELAQRRSDLEAARTRLANIHSRSAAILAKATAEGRDVTKDEQRQLDSLFGNFDKAELECKEIEADVDAIERTPRGRVSTPNPIASGPNYSGGRAVQSSGFSASPRNHAGMFKGTSDSYGNAFSSLGDFAKAVAAGNDSRLMRAYNSTTVGEGASAGYLVPNAFVQQMMDASLQQEVFRPRANVVPVSSGNVVISGFKSTDGTGNKRAGLVMNWGPEATDLLEQKPIAQEMQMRATKANIFCRVSSELAADAPNFDAMLSQAMTAAVAAGLDYAFINGTGAGQPLGVINGPSTITVAKESAQAANTLLLQNLANMVGRLLPASFARSVWFAHPTLVPLLYQMSYTTKNVAGSENVGGGHVQAVGHDSAGNLTIFGRPALVTDACSVLSAKGDIVLCDPMRYLITMRQDVRLARDTSVYFGSDEIGFRLTLRLDGAPEDGEPTKLRDGTNTVSPFVTLAAR